MTYISKSIYSTVLSIHQLLFYHISPYLPIHNPIILLSIQRGYVRDVPGRAVPADAESAHPPPHRTQPHHRRRFTRHVPLRKGKLAI